MWLWKEDWKVQGIAFSGIVDSMIIEALRVDNSSNVEIIYRTT